MEIITLKALRLTGMRLLAGMIVALALCVVVGALLATIPGKMPAAVLALLLTVLPCAMALQRRTDYNARMLASITVMIMPVLLLFVFESRSWQTDIHMTFFALLAIVAILCDWKPIFAGAALVAVHHIGFALLIPQWLFLGGDPVARVPLHAVILIVQAATLVWLAAGIVALITAVERENGERARAEASLAAERALQADAVAVVTGSLGEGLAALTEGDLTAEIAVEYPESYRTLRTNFNAALGKLRELIGSVSESAVKIRTDSVDIAQAAEDLAHRTKSTAASLEQTAASVMQMDGRLTATSTAASQIVERADQAIATVDSGRSVADEAVQAMGRVSESAEGIDSVIEGLDKIAFQTRVLAMNAAVEAGRAGEAGRGFAVVAALVSALAMRAEEEAKRARDQLTVTQTDIVTAVEAVEKVDGALANISGDVDHVHELLATMAADNEAQSATITQISSALGMMDRATQQNAAMVEETSAAARNLANEVGGLSDQAGRFNVGGGRNRATPTSRVAAATPASPQVDARDYASPVKSLPPAGIAALTRKDEECDAFLSAAADTNSPII